MFKYLTNRAFVGVFLLWVSSWVTVSFGKEEPWRTYETCSLVEDEYYDGDSFHIKTTQQRSRTYIFRLYFVDTAENNDIIPERLEEQATYWNITPKQAMDLGEQARRFTRDWLRERSFRVHTRREGAAGASKKKRYYAMIENKEPENEDDAFLSVALVKAGLARIYGKPTKLPDGRSDRSYYKRLDAAEAYAKAHKLGAWALDPAPPPPPPDPFAETIPYIEPQPLTLNQYVLVFSLKDPQKMVGRLRPGSDIFVLKAESSKMARIRFKAGEKRVLEAQCLIVELRNSGLKE